MRRVFLRSGDGVDVRLRTEERRAIGLALGILDGYRSDEADAATARLTYDPHPGDPDRSREFADLVAGDLDRMRAEDRSTFAATVGAVHLDADEADAWLRVIGEARLVLGARAGITDDGWSSEAASDPQLALLRLLSAVQDELVLTLMDGVEPDGA